MEASALNTQLFSPVLLLAAGALAAIVLMLVVFALRRVGTDTKQWILPVATLFVVGLAAVFIADRLSGRFPRARLYVPAAAALMTAALMGVAFGLLSPGALQCGVIVVGAMLMTGTVGPVAAVVVDVVHPSVRATAASVLSLTQNLFGLAAGPLLTGVLSDIYGLPFAMSVVPVSCVLAAGVFLFAARTYEGDLRAAGAMEPELGDSLEPQAA